jgi:superfamily II DNA/RNA helicase
MLYYKGELSQPQELAQKNMGKFMKILIIKRLESSFYAFNKTLERFIHSYQQFIAEFNKGNVYVSKKYTSKIFEFLENDDDEAIQRLVDEKKADKIKSKDFRSGFLNDLQSDLDTLLHIKSLWGSVKRDPKLLTFLDKLSSSSVLKNNKLIIFTESKETAEYLSKNINNKFTDQAICFTGGSSESIRDKVIENFDARARNKKDDYRILISTEVLSEGVNLHRSNVVINYDIPWNPTRMMQRVGRINRVDTKFDRIYTFNFFPTVQANNQIKLKEAAEAKINAFLTLLGGDAALLTEGEPIGSHELFNRLSSKQILTGEDESIESDLKYLQVIKNIRDKNPELFEKIKKLPKKARTSRVNSQHNTSLLTYFQRGKLQKFFLATSKKDAVELDFLSAAKILEADTNTKKQKLGENYYEFLDKNKQAFIFATTQDLPETKLRGGRDSATQVLRILKATLKDRRQFTDDQELYFQKVIMQLEEGGLPKQTTKESLKALNDLKNELINPFKVLAVLQTNIPNKLLDNYYSESVSTNFGKREVILSEYLTEN